MTTDNVHAEELLDLAHLPADVQSLFDAAEAHDFQNGLDWYRLLASTTLTAADRVSVLVCYPDYRDLRFDLGLLTRPTKLALGSG